MQLNSSRPIPADETKAIKHRPIKCLMPILVPEKIGASLNVFSESEVPTINLGISSTAFVDIHHFFLRVEELLLLLLDEELVLGARLNSQGGTA